MFIHCWLGRKDCILPQNDITNYYYKSDTHSNESTWRKWRWRKRLQQHPFSSPLGSLSWIDKLLLLMLSRKAGNVTAQLFHPHKHDDCQSDLPISVCAPCLPLREAGRQIWRNGEQRGRKWGNRKEGRQKKTGNTIRGKDQRAKNSEQGDETADSDGRRKLWQKTTQIFFWKYYSHLMLVSGLLWLFDMFSCIVPLCQNGHNF